MDNAPPTEESTPAEAVQAEPPPQFSYTGIRDVKFGQVAAEDDSLIKYFIETPEYRAIANQCTGGDVSRKILVLGRKGSGKSAIYQALQKILPQQDASVVVAAASLQDLSWTMQQKVGDQSDSSQTYKSSWLYILYIMLAKMLTDYNSPRDFASRVRHTLNTFNADYRYLYRFLEKYYGYIAIDMTEMLVQFFRRLKGGKLLGAEFDMAEGPQSERLLFDTAMGLRDLETRLLRCLSPQKQYFILLDELDIVWDKFPNSEALIGLILASKHVVKAAERAGQHVCVVIFLRDDIYDKLIFPDKNKITSTNTVRLRWDKDSLLSLIEKRIQVTSGGGWADLFDDSLMTDGKTQFRHIYERTMCRPRDMIEFCRLAHEIALQSGEPQITREAIDKVDRRYSDYMKRELQDENPEVIKLYFALMRRQLTYTTVTFIELKELCLREKIDWREMLTVLLNTSVLGVLDAGGRFGGSRMTYKYNTDDWELEYVMERARYYVHPSLKETLRLIKP